MVMMLLLESVEAKGSPPLSPVRETPLMEPSCAVIWCASRSAAFSSMTLVWQLPSSNVTVMVTCAPLSESMELNRVGWSLDP